MSEEIYELYKSDPDFKGYVDRWCRQKGCGIFEALQFAIIKAYAKIIQERKK